MENLDNQLLKPYSVTTTGTLQSKISGHFEKESIVSCFSRSSTGVLAISIHALTKRLVLHEFYHHLVEHTEEREASRFVREMLGRR